MHGRTYEPEVGLYYYRNRYYHPKLGRFLQQDPMGYMDSMNLYQGFGMNPVNFVDPYGLWNWFKMAGSFWKDMAKDPIGTINMAVKDVLYTALDGTRRAVHRNIDTARRLFEFKAKTTNSVDKFLADRGIMKRGQYNFMIKSFEGVIVIHTLTGEVQTLNSSSRNIIKNQYAEQIEGLPTSSTDIVHYDTYWSNTTKVLDYRPTGSGYVAVTSTSGGNVLTSGNQTTLTLNQVRNLRGQQRWQAGEQYVQELYGSPGQRHYKVPAEGEITGSGGRFVDAPVDGASGVLANEVKTYQQWRTIQGAPKQNQVTLNDHINQQIMKEVWLRKNMPGYDPRWLFLDAPPSAELASILKEKGIVYIIYK
jgi:RHS repeat-associated protein